MATVLYNCKRCKVGKRVEYPESRKGFGGRTEYSRRDGAGKTVSPGVWIERSGGGMPTVYGGDPLGVCASCKRMMAFGFVEGVHNPNVKCDARCTGARGASCECSCAGKNHGADWCAGAPKHEAA